MTVDSNASAPTDQANNNAATTENQDATTANDSKSDSNETVENTGDKDGSILSGNTETKEQDGSGQSSSEDDKSPVADAEIKIDLPEGVEVDEKLLDSFKEFAGENSLDSESASKLATWFASQQEAATKGQVEAAQQQSEKWGEELKTDPDFGGEQYSANVNFARQGVMETGGQPLADLLDQYGLGNHPVMVKAFARVGQANAEDNSSAVTAKGGTPSREEQLNKLYPTSAPEG